MSRGIALLFSGGVDSTACLMKALECEDIDYIVPFFVFYGQKMAAAEFQAARTIWIELLAGQDTNPRIRASAFTDLSIKCLGEAVLTSHGPDVPTYDNVHQAYVPFRNTVLVSLVASRIEARREIGEIWIGVHATDATNRFPDCTPQWAGHMDDVLACGMSRPVHLVCPNLGLTKQEVLNYMKKYPSILRHCYSGYGNVLQTGGANANEVS